MPKKVLLPILQYLVSFIVLFMLLLPMPSQLSKFCGSKLH